MISKIADEKIYNIINENDTVLISFFSPMDMASGLVNKNLNVVDSDYGDKLQIVLVDTFEAKELVKEFKILVVPTIIVFKEKRLIDRVHGYMPLDKITYMLSRYIKK